MGSLKTIAPFLLSVIATFPSASFADSRVTHFNFEDPELVNGTRSEPGTTITVHQPGAESGGECYAAHLTPHLHEGRGTLTQALAGYLQCQNSCVTAPDAQFYAECAVAHGDFECPTSQLRQGALQGRYSGSHYSTETRECATWASVSQHALFQGVDFLFLLDTSSSMRESEHAWIRTFVPQLARLAQALPAHSRVLLSSHDVHETRGLFKAFDLSQPGSLDGITPHIERILDSHGSNIERFLEALLDRRVHVRPNADVVAVLVTDEIDYSANRRAPDLILSDFVNWQSSHRGRIRLVSSTEASNQTEGNHSTWDATHLKGRVVELLGGEIVRPDPALLRAAILRQAQELLDIHRAQTIHLAVTSHTHLESVTLGGVVIAAERLQFNAESGQLTIPASVIAEVSRQLRRPPYGLEVKITLTSNSPIPTPWDAGPPRARAASPRSPRTLFWIELMERLVARDATLNELKPFASELALRHSAIHLIDARDWARAHAAEFGLTPQFSELLGQMAAEARISISAALSTADCQSWRRQTRLNARRSAQLQSTDPRDLALADGLAVRRLLNRVACEQ